MTGIPFLAVMGFAVAGTVAISVLIALTLLPALMGFLGARLAKGKRQDPNRRPMGQRWAELVTVRPLVTILGVIVLLGVIAVPALHLNLGLLDAGTKSKSDTERRAYDLLSEGFGPGFNGPLTVVLDAAGASARIQKLAPAAAAKGLASIPDVAAVSSPVSNSTGQVSIIIVPPNSGPASQATQNLVTRLRGSAPAVRRRYKVDALVTRTTALNIDTSDKLSAALPEQAKTERASARST